MKKLLIFAAAMAFVAIGAGQAVAGLYHSSSGQIVCSDCHTMHYSNAHNFEGGPATNLPLAPGGPFEALLRNKASLICLTCHDGQSFAPDVYGTNTNSYVRQAGAINKDSLAGDLPAPGAGYSDWMGHSLGSTTTAPGGTWKPGTEGFECINCHSTHGSVNYRNLSLRPGGVTADLPVTYALGTNDTTKDVFVRSYTQGAVATNYVDTNVDFNEPSQTASAMGTWCQGCHTQFHGNRTNTNMYDGSAFVRHPTADADIRTGVSTKTGLPRRFSTVAYRVKVMSGTGNWGTYGTPLGTTTLTTLTPTCISCHKSHGTKNAFGLIYAKGDAPLGEDGDGTGVRDLCWQCHSQGR